MAEETELSPGVAIGIGVIIFIGSTLNVLWPGRNLHPFWAAIFFFCVSAMGYLLSVLMIRQGMKRFKSRERHDT